MPRDGAFHLMVRKFQMGKLGAWLAVLLLAVGVVVYWHRYVRPQDDSAPLPTEKETAETLNTDADTDAADRRIVQEEPEEETLEEIPHEVDPTASELLSQAVRAQEAGNGEAIELFRKVVESYPKSEAAVQAAARLADYYYEQGEVEKTLKYLKAALSGKLPERQRNDFTRKLNELSMKVMFDADKNPRVSYYIAKQGDTLSKIGRKYNVPWELLKRLNGLKNDKIRIDDRLKVVRGPFDAIVERSKFKLTVYLGNKYVKSYKVGLGKDGSTPAGAFKVQSKLTEPDWYRPGKIIKYGDPENALGTRWIGFMKGYGIHGTWEPASIGSHCSEGCVRMLNKDVEELFDFLIVGKSKIRVKK